MPEFEIKTVPLQHIAAIGLSSSKEEIGETMSQAFPKVFHAITEAGVAPAGPPLARYFTFGGPSIDFECAIPVATPLAGEGEVQPGQIGGGEAAVARHVGPYDTIGQTWQALMGWLEAQGRKPAGPGWESYVTDPSEELDPTKWETELCQPVA